MTDVGRASGGLVIATCSVAVEGTASAAASVAGALIVAAAEG
jgi:hypothetical protein